MAKLTKDTQRALDAYIVLRIRLRELKAFLLIARFEQRGMPGFESNYFVNNNYLASAIFGWTFSLIDRNSAAANLFDVWRTLFPEKRDRVDAFVAVHSDAIERLEFYRNNAAFHGNRNPERYIRATVQLLSEFSTMNTFFAELDALEEEFLALDQRILAQLDTALISLAERLNIPAERIREQMFWRAQGA